MLLGKDFTDNTGFGVFNRFKYNSFRFVQHNVKINDATGIEGIL